MRVAPRKFLAVYEAIGLLFLLTSLYVLLHLYVIANQNGVLTGHYTAMIDTNSAGENIYEVIALIVFAPAGFLVIGHFFWLLLKPTYEGYRRRRQERLSR